MSGGVGREKRGTTPLEGARLCHLLRGLGKPLDILSLCFLSCMMQTYLSALLQGLSEMIYLGLARNVYCNANSFRIEGEKS